MKKSIVLLLLILALCACSNKEDMTKEPEKTKPTSTLTQEGSDKENEGDTTAQSSTTPDSTDTEKSEEKPSDSTSVNSSDSVGSSSTGSTGSGSASNAGSGSSGSTDSGSSSSTGSGSSSSTGSGSSSNVGSSSSDSASSDNSGSVGSENSKKKILLDTDIGCDYDDSMALAYLLNHEKVDLVGITTCTGSPHKRAMLAEIICNAQGKDIPIYPGAENPLVGSIVQWGLDPYATQVINSYPHSDYQNTNQAVEYMRRVIMENPHEITLACIGPLTNAALLFSTYPETAKLLDGMIIMGGKFGACDSYWGETEWNIKCDYKAASIVFRQDIEDCLVVGVEVTSQFFKNSLYLRGKFFQKVKYRPVRDVIPTESKNVWFHDILPLIAYLDDEGVISEYGNISVLLDGTVGNPIGTTVFKVDKNRRHQLITGYSEELLFQKYSEVVGIDFTQ